MNERKTSRRKVDAGADGGNLHTLLSRLDLVQTDFLLEANPRHHRQAAIPLDPATRKEFGRAALRLITSIRGQINEGNFRIALYGIVKLWELHDLLRGYLGGSAWSRTISSEERDAFMAAIYPPVLGVGPPRALNKRLSDKYFKLAESFHPLEQMAREAARARQGRKANHPKIEADHRRVLDTFNKVERTKGHLSFSRKCDLVSRQLILRQGRRLTARQIRNIVSKHRTGLENRIREIGLS